MTNYIPNRNYQKRRKFALTPNTIADPAYKKYAMDVVDSTGNEPGEPNAFKNITRANTATERKITPESINIETNNDSIITKIFRKPLFTYQAMVDDVPFDKKHFDRVYQNLQMMGYGSLLLSAAYLTGNGL